ncbi:MAG: hypothetical protein V3S55_01610 [Nitrospiraceae bacterium]
MRFPIEDLVGKIELLTGQPELVIVDARVLRLLMGDLAPLIILKQFTPEQLGLQIVSDERFVWDDDPVCP